MKGKISKYFKNKGFGFVKLTNGRRCYFNNRALAIEYENVLDGDEVNVEFRDSVKKPGELEATRIEFIRRRQAQDSESRESVFDSDLKIARVKIYFPHKGFGFLESRNSPDIFFHQSSFPRDFSIVEGTVVFTLTRPSRKVVEGIEAAKIIPLDVVTFFKVCEKALSIHDKEELKNQVIGLLREFPKSKSFHYESRDAFRSFFDRLDDEIKEFVFQQWLQSHIDLVDINYAMNSINYFEEDNFNLVLNRADKEIIIRIVEDLLIKFGFIDNEDLVPFLETLLTKISKSLNSEESKEEFNKIFISSSVNIRKKLTGSFLNEKIKFYNLDELLQQVIDLPLLKVVDTLIRLNNPEDRDAVVVRILDKIEVHDEESYEQVQRIIKYSSQKDENTTLTFLYRYFYTKCANSIKNRFIQDYVDSHPEYIPDDALEQNLKDLDFNTKTFLIGRVGLALTEKVIEACLEELSLIDTDNNFGKALELLKLIEQLHEPQLVENITPRLVERTSKYYKILMWVNGYLLEIDDETLLLNISNYEHSILSAILRKSQPDLQKKVILLLLQDIGVISNSRSYNKFLRLNELNINENNEQILPDLNNRIWEITSDEYKVLLWIHGYARVLPESIILMNLHTYTKKTLLEILNRRDKSLNEKIINAGIAFENEVDNTSILTSAVLEYIATDIALFEDLVLPKITDPKKISPILTNNQFLDNCPVEWFAKIYPETYSEIPLEQLNIVIIRLLSEKSDHYFNIVQNIMRNRPSFDDSLMIISHLIFSYTFFLKRGRYSGESIQWLYFNNSSYLSWVYSNYRHNFKGYSYDFVVNMLLSTIKLIQYVLRELDSTKIVDIIKVLGFKNSIMDDNKFAFYFNDECKTSLTQRISSRIEILLAETSMNHISDLSLKEFMSRYNDLSFLTTYKSDLTITDIELIEERLSNMRSHFKDSFVLTPPVLLDAESFNVSRQYLEIAKSILESDGYEELVKNIYFNSIPEYKLRLWLYGYTYEFDFTLFACYYFVLTKEEKKLFKEKAEIRQKGILNEELLFSLIPIKLIEESEDNSRLYSANWRSIKFGNGKINFCLSEDNLSADFPWEESKEDYNLIRESLKGKRVEPLSIYMQNDFIIKVDGLDSLFNVIRKIEYLKKINEDPEFRYNLKYTKDTLPINILIKNECINTLTKLSSKSHSIIHVLEKVWSSGNDGSRIAIDADFSFLFTIELDRYSLGLVWESSVLEKSKATYLFKSSYDECEKQKEYLVSLIENTPVVRSTIISNREVQQNVGFIGRIEHDNFDLEKWKNKLVEYWPQLTAKMKEIDY